MKKMYLNDFLYVLGYGVSVIVTYIPTGEELLNIAYYTGAYKLPKNFNDKKLEVLSISIIDPTDIIIVYVE